MSQEGMAALLGLIEDSGYGHAPVPDSSLQQVRVVGLATEIRLHVSERYPSLACAQIEVGVLPSNPTQRLAQCEELLLANALVADDASPMFSLVPGTSLIQLTAHFDLSLATPVVFHDFVTMMCEIAEDWGPGARKGSDSTQTGSPPSAADLRHRA